MIASLTVLKDGTARVRYESGASRDYNDIRDLPKKVRKWILRFEVKAFETPAWTVYKVA